MFRLERIRDIGERFLTCGDYRLGVAGIRRTSPNCGHDCFRPFSCKGFYLCPSCSQKRTLLFAEAGRFIHVPFSGLGQMTAVFRRRLIWLLVEKELLAEYIARPPLSLKKIRYEPLTLPFRKTPASTRPAGWDKCAAIPAHKHAKSTKRLNRDDSFSYRSSRNDRRQRSVPSLVPDYQSHLGPPPPLGRWWWDSR